MQPEVLAVEVEVRTGSFELAAKFHSAAPWTVLFGPSGSGKSTLLRTIAGFVRPRRGTVQVLGEPLVDCARGLFVAPNRRPVRWAGQRTSLFSTMTVRQNLAYAVERAPGRKQMGRKLMGRKEIVERAVATFALGDFADCRPAALSGGQQQLVAVARAAIDARARLLLLDEPFTGLDEALRAQLLASLRVWRGAAPVLSVTHDVAEAFLLQAEVVRLREGKVVAQGPAAEVLAGERDRLRGVLG